MLPYSKKSKIKFLFIVFASVLDFFPHEYLSAQYSISNGQSCSSRGQIRDFQAQRFICLKVNAKAGSSSGPSLVWVKISSPKSTTKSTTTTVSVTSTTIKKSCQEGGICKIGDRGPGGGFVFYVNPDKSATPWQYLEIAPDIVNQTHYSEVKGPIWVSGYSASAAAEAYKTESNDDWFLPTDEQLVSAFEKLFFLPNPPLIFACNFENPGCNRNSFWTASSEKPDYTNSVQIVSYNFSTRTIFKIQPKVINSPSKYFGIVIAIRGFSAAS